MTTTDIAKAREFLAAGYATRDAAWFVDNCQELLDGWSAALDEIERLQGELARERP